MDFDTFTDFHGRIHHIYYKNSTEPNTGAVILKSLVWNNEISNLFLKAKRLVHPTSSSYYTPIFYMVES